MMRAIMPEPQFTPAATVAWQTASSEALKTRYSVIEPLHVLIGICSLEETLSEPRPEQQVSSEIAMAIKSEWNLIATLFFGLSADVHILRRCARAALGRGQTPLESHEIHSSPETKAVFSRAAAFANSNHGGPVTTLELTAALFEDSLGPVAGVASERGIDCHALQAQAQEFSRRLKSSEIGSVTGSDPGYIFPK